MLPLRLFEPRDQRRVLEKLARLVMGKQMIVKRFDEFLGTRFKRGRERPQSLGVDPGGAGTGEEHHATVFEPAEQAAALEHRREGIRHCRRHPARVQAQTDALGRQPDLVLAHAVHDHADGSIDGARRIAARKPSLVF